MKHAAPILWIATIIGLLYLSRSFLNPRFFIGHDTVAHVSRSQAYNAAVDEGQFPVRYIGWAFEGTGSPIFNHYPIGFYTAVAFLHQIGLPFHTAFYGIVWFSWIMTGVGLAFLLSRYSRLSAWIAAVLWWISPYAAMDIYMRAAYPELLAINWSVWLFFAFDRWLMTRQFKYIWILVLFAALLGITHLPTALLLAPLLIGYFILHQPTLKMVSSLLAAALLALGIAAFYVLPSVGELNHIKSEELHQDYYDYQWHFLTPWQLFSGAWSYGYSNPGIDQDASFKLSLGQWVIIIVIALMADYFWLTIILGYLFISLSLSKPLWDNLPFMAYVQYPWRSHAIATLAVAVAAGRAVKFPSRKWVRFIIGISTLGIAWETYTWFQPFNYQPVQLYHSSDYSRHQPPFPEIGIETAYTNRFSNVNAVKNHPMWHAKNPNTTINPSKTTSTVLAATINSSQEDEITLRRWSLPGWKGVLDGNTIPLYTTQTGLISIKTPPGNHTLKIEYQGTLLQHMSNYISIASIIIWIMGIRYCCKSTN